MTATQVYSRIEAVKIALYLDCGHVQLPNDSEILESITEYLPGNHRECADCEKRIPAPRLFIPKETRFPDLTENQQRLMRYHAEQTREQPPKRDTLVIAIWVLGLLALGIVCAAVVLSW